MREKILEPLDDYLKSLYPERTEDEIQQYISWLEDDEADRLPATKEIVEYVSLDATVKKNSARMEELRKIIISQRQRLKHKFCLLDIRTSTRKSYDEIELYKWAADNFPPDIVERVTTKVLNATEFKRLEAAGEIVYDKLPDNCYKESEAGYTLTPIKPKKNKNKDIEQ